VLRRKAAVGKTRIALVFSDYNLLQTYEYNSYCLIVQVMTKSRVLQTIKLLKESGIPNCENTTL
jgi:hypothetical protein